MKTEENYKYTIQGEKVIPVNKVNDGWLVKYLIKYSDEYGEYEDESEPRFVSGKIFDNPPISIVQEDIQKLLNQKENISKEIDAIIKEFYKLKADRADFLNKLKTNDNLKNFENLMDGKITHIVAFGSCDSDIDIVDLKKIGNSNDFTLQLNYLAIGYNNWQKQAIWSCKIRDYHRTSVLFTSYDEAFQWLQKYIQDNYLKKADYQRGGFIKFIEENFDKLTLSKEVIEAFRKDKNEKIASRKRQLTDYMKRAQSEFDNYKKQLENIENT